MKSEFILAFNEIAELRKLPREVIMDALKAALVSAYRRSSEVSSGQNVEARVDDKTGEPTIWAEKEVVEEVANEQTEVTLSEAQESYPEAQLGDMVMIESTPGNFGRIAAQTAKQVILQRMREAERDAQFQEYRERIGDLITGTVQSNARGVVTIGLGRTEAIMPPSQQMPGEQYRMHDKVRAYVMDVNKTNRGPQIVVSRTHRNMLRRLLEYEVPEIYNGTVEIKSIAREPGARSKVAVAALQEGADPVGACVGMRGVRIQSIVKELNNEKIDVIEWNPDQAVFISKALSPARVSGVFLDDNPDEGRTAIVVVPDDQLSLAIGREGQNARLAAKLTGWRIDIKSVTEATQDAFNHLENPELAGLVQQHAEFIEQIQAVLEKKETNRVVTPEDYHLLVDFVNIVEDARLEMREAEYAEKRAQREAIRAEIPPAAYEHPLEDTDLPKRVYDVLAGAGYNTAGEVIEQYQLDAERFSRLSGFGESMLESIETMIDTIEFAEPEIEEIPDEVTEEAGLVEPEIELETVPESGEVILETVGDEAATTEATEATVLEQIDKIRRPEEDETESLARAQRAALVAQMLAEEGQSLDSIGTTEEAAVLEEPIVAEALEPIRHSAGEGDEVYSDLDEEWPEDMDEEQIARERRRRDKQLRRQLVYDEDLGRVVAKRRRKGSRKRDEWDDYTER